MFPGVVTSGRALSDGRFRTPAHGCAGRDAHCVVSPRTSRRYVVTTFTILILSEAGWQGVADTLRRRLRWRRVGRPLLDRCGSRTAAIAEFADRIHVAHPGPVGSRGG